MERAVMVHAGMDLAGVRPVSNGSFEEEVGGVKFSGETWRSMYPKIGVFQNGWFIMENLLKWMIWGYHYFWKHHIYIYIYIYMPPKFKPETNSSHLKINRWKMYFLLGSKGLFSGALYVCFREGICKFWNLRDNILNPWKWTFFSDNGPFWKGT